MTSESSTFTIKMIPQNEGWTCPVCRTIYSPNVTTCGRCSPCPIPPECLHDYDFNSTLPACRKCGLPMEDPK